MGDALPEIRASAGGRHPGGPGPGARYGAADAVARTDAANMALVEMENRAFDLIRQDHLESARAILFSRAYDEQKRIYQRGWTPRLRALGVGPAGAGRAQASRVRMVLITLAAAMSLLVFCWFVALRTMNRGNAALVLSHQRLSRQSAELARETQLRGQSEARLRAVLDAALDAVIGMDVDDVITYWNPRAEAIFGWGREEALGRRLGDLIIPERYREAHSRGLARFLATGEGPVLDRGSSCRVCAATGRSSPSSCRSRR